MQPETDAEREARKNKAMPPPKQVRKLLTNLEISTLHSIGVPPFTIWPAPTDHPTVRDPWHPAFGDSIRFAAETLRELDACMLRCVATHSNDGDCPFAYLQAFTSSIELH